MTTVFFRSHQPAPSRSEAARIWLADRQRSDGSGADGQVATRPKAKKALKLPRLYRILLHNDDFTPREFVVLVLQHVFAKGEAESTALMLHVHNNEVGVVGLYPYSVAETKIAEVTALSEEANFPLLFTMEPDESPDDDDDQDSDGSQ